MVVEGRAASADWEESPLDIGETEREREKVSLNHSRVERERVEAHNKHTQHNVSHSSSQLV